MNNRLETFCDGVFAIAVTLLILELKIPPLESIQSTAELWAALGHLWPSLFALLFSFTIIFISWIGHHNFMRLIDKSSGRFLVANGFFLLTVIIIPFPTAFMAEYLNTPYAQPAIVVYSLSILLHNLGWVFLNRAAQKPLLLAKNEPSAVQMKKSARGSIYGFIMYSSLALLAWWFPHVSISINAFTWAYWLVLSLSLTKAEAE